MTADEARTKMTALFNEHKEHITRMRSYSGSMFALSVELIKSLVSERIPSCDQREMLLVGVIDPSASAATNERILSEIQAKISDKHGTIKLAVRDLATDKTYLYA